MSASSFVAMRRGLVTGALAGLWIAFGDYGATWLWLPVVRDRAWLLVRLLASIVPVAALLGLLAALVGALCWRGARRLLSAPTAAAAWPAPLVAAALPPSLWLADKLCSGGAMSRLAARYPLEAAFAVALPTALYGVLYGGARAGRWVLAAPGGRALPAAGALLALATLLGKLNQIVLPNLYDYLHGLLALATWAIAALGLALLAYVAPRGARLGRALDRPLVAPLVGAALALTAVANASTLDQNLNVRVAMFDARSPTSRALLASGEPLLRRLERASPAWRPSGPVRGERAAAGEASAAGAHVLLVTIDALRADHLGTYGYARPVSPRMDALAAGAVVYERAYAQAPHSSYSLSSLHTSEYVHEVVELGRPLPTATLARAFAEHGYHTAAFFTDGIFHTEGAKLSALRDSAFGFALFDHTNRAAEQQTDRVLQEAERIRQRGEPPSLMWVHYFDVHEPYQATTFGTGEMDRYDSEILHVDRELDRLVRELDARFERPLVIAISADHGEEFRDHGGVYHGSTLYDEQVRVPLILRAPGLTPGRVAAPVEVIDIAPTLLATVGVAIPPSMRGRDLRAVAADPTRAGPVFSAVLTKRMALRWPYKLIADLRFDLFELYDLERDPKERRNLAGDDPTRRTELRGLVYGWLDEIERAPGAPSVPDAHSAETDYRRALHLGRLGDRRAVAPTAALLLDRSAPTALRVEAGQNLAKLADPSAVPALLEGLHTEPQEVAREAAIALGRMYDERARAALRPLMHLEDPHVRARAAVSLGRLRDPAAVPALIDALWVAPTQYEREEAVRWLGRLRDPAAVEPLLSLLPEFSLRYLLAVALGQIGDPRAYPALVDMLGWESRTNIRDEVVRGLGLLGDARAIPRLVEVLDQEPGLTNTAESLVRLGALERGALGGLDLGPESRPRSGFARCEAGPLQHDWNYAGRTACITSSQRVQLALPFPADAPAFQRGAELVLRSRRADTGEAVACTLTLGGRLHSTLQLDGGYREQRIDVPDDLLQGRRLDLVLACDANAARIAIDHALLVPHTEVTASTGSPRAKTPDDAQVLQ